MSEVRNKPLGPSVNIALRLLKNHVTEATGWRPYALFTKECFSRIWPNSTEYHHQTETFEHIGGVETFSIDLNAQYEKYVSERIVYISYGEADFVAQKDFPIAPSLLWEWLSDPKKRSQWNEGSNWNALSRPTGRMGRGSTNHCVNSKIIEMILDYRPFEYYTSTMGRDPVNFTLTYRCEAIPQGCRLFWHVKMNGILPTMMKRAICKLLLEKGMGVHRNFDRLRLWLRRKNWKLVCEVHSFVSKPSMYTTAFERINSQTDTKLKNVV